LGRRDAFELVALGCVDIGSDCFTRLDGLEHLRSKTGALVVDIDTLERECSAICISLVIMLEVMGCQARK
jgi:hypothetical protein